MFKDFKEFAMRGNVVDMAIGIVIGAAFGTIVKSFVDDVLMPPIGLLLGNVDFSNLFITLKEGAKAAGPYASLAAAKAAGAVTLNLGLFINTIISFIIIAFAVFLVIKGINRMKREKEARRPSLPPRNAPSASPPSPSRPVAAATAPRSYRRHKDGNRIEPGLAAKTQEKAGSREACLPSFYLYTCLPQNHLVTPRLTNADSTQKSRLVRKSLSGRTSA